MITYTVTIKDNGDTTWRLNGTIHREGGPAVYNPITGYKAWYLNGKLHREGEPAVEYANGYKVWYLNGVIVTEAERMDPVREMTMAEITEALGHEVKVIK